MDEVTHYDEKKTEQFNVKICPDLAKDIRKYIPLKGRRIVRRALIQAINIEKANEKGA